jgi:hypothetical protein
VTLSYVITAYMRVSKSIAPPALYLLPRPAPTRAQTRNPAPIVVDHISQATASFQRIHPKPVLLLAITAKGTIPRFCAQSHLGRTLRSTLTQMQPRILSLTTRRNNPSTSCVLTRLLPSGNKLPFLSPRLISLLQGDLLHQPLRDLRERKRPPQHQGLGQKRAAPTHAAQDLPVLLRPKSTLTTLTRLTTKVF